MIFNLAFLLLAVVASTYGNFSVESIEPNCPPWMMLQDENCVCRDAFSNLVRRNFIQPVFCDKMSLTTYAVSGTCVTSSNDSSIDDEVVFGDCLYVPVKDQKFFFGFFRPLPQNFSDLDEAMCSPFNRQGLLCGSCRPGYGIAVYSIGYPCAKCNAKGLYTLLYILLEMVPTTALYFIVIVFRIRATTPPLAGLVFFSHTILQTLRIRIFIHTAFLFSTTTIIRIGWTLAIFLCSIWNLDFFRVIVPPFCIGENIDNIQAILLHYISAFYPLILVFITYLGIELHGNNVRLVVWLWKPFHRCFARIRRTWNIQHSIVNAFSTFLLLSYTKILSISFRLLYQSSIYNVNGTRIASALQIHPTLRTFKSYHSAISLMAILIIMVFSILPLLLLLLYPTKLFQKALQRCTCRAKHAVHLFVNTYQGSLKDGSSGTRDYRAVSALYLILRISLLSLYINNTVLVETGLSFILFCIIFILVSIFMVAFKPYKAENTNYSEFGMFFLLGIAALNTYVWFIYPQNGYAIINVVIILLPHCALMCYIAYRIFGRQKGILGWIKRHLPQIDNDERGGTIASSSRLKKLLRTFSSDNTAEARNEELPDRFVNPECYISELTSSYTRQSSENDTSNTSGSSI